MRHKTRASTRVTRLRTTPLSTRLRVYLLLFQIASVSIVSACGAPTRVSGTVVMASGTDLESGNPLVTVHPLTRQMQRHALFVTLVRLDPALQPTPYYARRWTWDDAHRILTFVLDSGLRWHDGARTSAADARFTINAARNPKLGSPRAGELAAIDSVHARSDTELMVYFRDPMPTMPTIFAELPIVPMHVLDTVPLDRWRAHAFSTAPIGNGPFRFLDRAVGRRWRFVRNASFPISMGGPPQLSQIVVTVVDESATKFAGLVSGDLDVAGVSPNMAALVQRDPTLVLMTPPSLFSTVLAFNTTRAPFRDARVRRAVSMAINRVQLVRAAVAGFATPAGGAIPPGLPFQSTSAQLPDATGADALLDSAGWKRVANGQRAREGRPLALTLLSVGSGDQAVEQLVQADLRARGVAVTIRIAELTTFLTTLRAKEKLFDFALTGIPGDIALGNLSAMFMSSQRGGALDYTGFHTGLLDSALRAAREASADNVSEKWQHVERILRDSMPIAWLYHARGVQGRSRRLDHVTMDLRGELVSISQWTRRDSL